MKALIQHFDCNYSCFAEFENQETVTVYSFKNQHKFWKLNSNQYYLYRIYCNPLKEQPNPFNIYLGKASDLVGYKNDEIHSKTHIGCLYEIVEITKLPFIPNTKPMEIVKLLQNYIPNLSFKFNYIKVLKQMRDVIRNNVKPEKNTIFHWLMTIKYLFNEQKLLNIKINSADTVDEPLRKDYAEAIYDDILEHTKNNEDLTNTIVGIIYESQCIPLMKIFEWQSNKENLFEIVGDIIKELSN